MAKLNHMNPINVRQVSGEHRARVRLAVATVSSGMQTTMTLDDGTVVTVDPDCAQGFLHKMQRKLREYGFKGISYEGFVLDCEQGREREMAQLIKETSESMNSHFEIVRPEKKEEEEGGPRIC